MSGFIEDLSPEQGAALETLRAAVSDVPELADKDDRYLLRWLRARKFHTAKAEDMLRKHIETRQKYKLDSILTDYKPNEVLEKYFPGGMMGEDREGHPVWYDHFNYDFKGLHYSVRMDEVLLLSLYRAELALKMCATASAEKGRPIETVTFVVSYEKLSIQRHYYWPGIQMIRKTLALLEANYPETIKQTFFINLPAIFPLCFNLLKPYINENTRAKIFVLGSNYREVLLKHICPDQLPAAFGGTRCEPDPDCTKYINLGGDVPEQYYLANLLEKAKDEMEKVTVGRGSTHLVPFTVETPGTILKWEFMSTDHDIGFGWFYKKEPGKKEAELVPVKRRKSHLIPESGMHVCEAAGEYVLKFDNSYSWTRSKEVYYTVKVILPEPPLPETTPTETEATPTHTDTVT